MFNFFKLFRKRYKVVNSFSAADFFMPATDPTITVDTTTFYNNPVVRQCVDFILTSIQRVPLVLYKNGEKIQDEKELFNANKVSEDSLVAFKNKMVRDYILHGAAQIAVVRKDPSQVFEKARLIDVQTGGTLPQYDDDTGNVAYYKHNDFLVPSFHTFKDPFLSKAKRKKDDYTFIAEWKQLALSDSLSVRGSYLDVLAPYVDTMAALTSRANSLAKGAYNIKHIIATERANIEEKKKLASILENSKRNDDIVIVNGLDLTVHSLDNTVSNIFDKVSTDDIKRTIAGVFGVPVALISPASVDGSKYASNFKESRMFFYEDTLIPRYLVPMQEFLSSVLFPDEYKLVFDLDSIDCLREKRISFYEMVDSVGFLTEDEKRNLVGLK